MIRGENRQYLLYQSSFVLRCNLKAIEQMNLQWNFSTFKVAWIDTENVNWPEGRSSSAKLQLEIVIVLNKTMMEARKNNRKCNHSLHQKIT